MITIKNALCPDNSRRDFFIPSSQSLHIDAENYIAFPGLIDPHVHFRIPGQAYKEDWGSAALAAIHGGFTCVFDMPNNIPSCTTLERLQEKKRLIDSELAQAKIPLNYHLYFGADMTSLDEIAKVNDRVIGLKIFMGSSTGNLLISKEGDLRQVFALAAQLDMLVAVHAECDCMIQDNRQKWQATDDFSVHAKIRSPEVAASATELAINIAKDTKARLMVLHVSSKEEVALIAQAKKEGISVYAETSPHHLFLDDTAYAKLGAKAQVNPPIRDKSHQEALWAGIHDNTIDTLGSDHAPHTLAEKAKPYGEAPSGMPGIETTLPLLMTAFQQSKISLQQIERLCHSRINEIYRLPQRPNELVLVDPHLEKKISDSLVKSKCQWSAFSGSTLRGFPILTIVNGHAFQVY